MPLSDKSRSSHIISAGKKQPGMLHLLCATVDVRSSLVCLCPLPLQEEEKNKFRIPYYALLCGAAQHSEWGLIVPRNQLFTARRLWTWEIDVVICYAGRGRRANAAAHPSVTECLTSTGACKKRGQAGRGVPALGPSAACAPSAERQRRRASRAWLRLAPRAASHSAAAAPAPVRILSHPITTVLKEHDHQSDQQFWCSTCGQMNLSWC